MRILVADDNDMLRAAAVHVLECEGHEVFEARDGHNALEMFDVCMPEVVLMGIQMPRINGVQVTRVLRARKIHTPIYAWTATPQELEGAHHLFAGVIGKSVSLVTVAQTIVADLGRIAAAHSETDD